MMYARERAIATDRRPAGQGGLERATVQSSFLDLVEPLPILYRPIRLSTRRAVKRVDTSMRQLTFAEIDKAWQ